MDSMAAIGGSAYFVTAAATTATGWLADRLIARGATPTRVRKTCTAAGLGCATVVLAVAVVSSATASIAILMLACVSYGVFASSHWAITQTLAGPLAAGKWTGLQNFFANLAGVVAPVLTGFVVDRTGHFFWAFAAAAAIALAGSLVYVFILGPVTPVNWRTSAG
jgi:MFS family permease